MNPYPWEGDYFAGLPIELEAVAEPGYRFSHWEGLPEDTPAQTRLEPDADLTVTAHFVPEAPPFLHAWVFDADMANNTPLEQIEASVSHGATGRLLFHSALAGYPFDEDHEQWRTASMERRNQPTRINYPPLDVAFDDANMRGLQVRQPFVGDGGENTLVFELPTTDHSGAVFRFAAMDEGAAEGLRVDYSVAEGEPVWTSAGLNQTRLPLSDEFQHYSINFSGIAAVNNNPHFRVRIRFYGDDLSADDGDRVTFNNISLDLQQETELAYFWLFDNDLANNTELETIAPHFSSMPGAYLSYRSALEGYPDTDRQASLERRNEPTELNYWPRGNFGTDYADVNMRAIQVRQPFVGPAGENTLVLRMPTTGMSRMMLRFAAMDEGAADALRIDYAVNAGEPQWTRAGLSEQTLPLVEDSFQLYEVDFSGIAMVNDNPHFRVRIRFSGDDLEINDGDRVTFNNISLHSLTDPGREGEGVVLPPVDPDNPDAPANNRFAYAQSISGASGNVSGTNRSATTQEGEPDHSAATGVAGDHSVWWTWRAPDTERVAFSVARSAADSALAVYTGDDLDTLTPVEAAYEYADQLWFVAQAGREYRIAVTGADQSRGDLALEWDTRAPAAPPIVIDTEPGQPGIRCELALCDLDDAGNVTVSEGDTRLHIRLPDQADDAAHDHQMQRLENSGGVLWSTEFSTELPEVLSRIIADTEGLPVVISRFALDNGNQYQVEAYPGGLARQRILSPAEELLRVQLNIPGSHTRVAPDGSMTLTAPLADDSWRLRVEVSAEARLTARYEQQDGDTWSVRGDVLTDTEFAPGSVLEVMREQGRALIRIDSRVDDDIYF